MVRSPVLRDHVAAAVLDVAARLLAERGEAASLAEIAEAAGVARSTLYRYFPNRVALLQSLAEAAGQEIATTIAQAQLETLPVAEALARLTRGFIAAGGKYIALATLWPKPADRADEFAPVLLDFFERGAADGTLRTDVPAALLLAMYSDLLEGTLKRMAAAPSGTPTAAPGVEAASSALLTVFLDGARPAPR
jgi:TetR/AcrR family transcriptional regulator, mexCD-oprJ operon repressor